MDKDRLGVSGSVQARAKWNNHNSKKFPIIMEVDQQKTLLDLNGSSETQASSSIISTPLDLVGGSFAVIESDPGWFVYTVTTDKLSIILFPITSGFIFFFSKQVFSLH